MKFALIQDSRICEFAATASDCFPVAPDLQWVSVADDTTDADSFVGGVVVKYVPSPSPPASILSQDLMAQLTSSDKTLIKAATDNNIDFWGMWFDLAAQKDPMIVTNPRFLAGWGALTQVLGQPRMDAIATALNVTVS